MTSFLDAREDWRQNRDPDEAVRLYLANYDDPYNREYLAAVERMLAPLARIESHVLDYACGGGWLTRFLARRARSVTAVDASEAALGAARRLCEMDGVAARCRFIRSDDLRTVDGTFDLLVAKDIIEHVGDDVAFLRELRARAAPGASLVLSTQNSLSLNYALEAPVRRRIMGNRGWMGWDPTHLRFYTPRSLSAKLRSAGWSVTGFRSVYLFPYQAAAKLLARLSGGAVPVRWPMVARLDARLGRMAGFDRLGWSLAVSATAAGAWRCG